MADINTDKIDFGRCAMLLDVVHKCATVGPKLTSLGNAAMTELTKLNEAIADVSRKAEIERQRAEAEANAQAQAKANAEADYAAAELEREGMRPRPVAPRSFPSTNTETLADQNIDRRI